MSKERLEEIERLRGIDRRLIAFEHTDWLIEQAKRVEELESQVENWQKGRHLAISTIDKEREFKKTNTGAGRCCRKLQKKHLDTLILATKWPKNKTNAIGKRWSFMQIRKTISHLMEFSYRAIKTRLTKMVEK